MSTLISPKEVIDTAFNGSPVIESFEIPESIILAAEQKFIKPVLGNLFPNLQSGSHSSLLSEYIKPALAYYVKLLLIPTMSVQTGMMGVVRWKGDNFAPADNKYISALSKSTRSQANTLMQRAVDHIESNPAAYPEYDPAENVLNRISICSSIVL